MQRTDAIVSPCENLILRHDKGVGLSLAEYAGPRIYDVSKELVRKERALIWGQTYESKPGMLNCKRLLHSVITPRERNKRLNKSNIRNLICGMLDKANRSTTLSLPLLLWEDHALTDVEMFATILLDKIDQMQASDDFKLKQVRLTSEESDEINIIVEVASLQKRQKMAQIPAESNSSGPRAKQSIREGDLFGETDVSYGV